MIRSLLGGAFALLFATISVSSARAAPDAEAILRSAFDNWRAKSSYTEIDMTVHRADWERAMSMSAWTRGDDDALVRFTAPAKDAGNATLTQAGKTWIFNPRLNQVVRLPASMMAQSWMGSDFSYNDLSKSDDLLTEYDHQVAGTTRDGGHSVYLVDCMPHPSAPVVWGKVRMRVRDDGVMLGETFFDQAMKPVREMTTDRVGTVGGRVYPISITMRPVGQSDHWTRIETTVAKFDVKLPDSVFSLSNLQNPRR